MATFDAGFLSLLFRPKSRTPDDPSTGKPVERAKERIEYLVDTLSATGEKIIVPTPALSEFLMLLGADAADVLMSFHSEAAFQVKPFDERSAIELVSLSDIKPGENKQKEQGGSWAKIKFDRQIVAIAKTHGRGGVIYSTDKDLCKLAEREGLKTVECHHLPLPPPENLELFEKRELDDTATEGATA